MEEVPVHYPRPPHRPQAYRVRSASQRHHTVRNNRSTAGLLRTVLARVHGLQPARV